MLSTDGAKQVLKSEWPTPVDFGGAIKSLLTPVPQTAMPTARARRLPVKKIMLSQFVVLIIQRSTTFASFTRMILSYLYFFGLFFQRSFAW